MPGYEPLDISAVGTAGVESLDGRVEAGEHAFRGLPFVVPDRVLVGAGATIEVGRVVNHVIFAHRLLDSELLDGGPVGVPVADYVFHLDGAPAVTATIRERFEIAAIPT